MSAIDDRYDAAGMITELGQLVTISGSSAVTYTPGSGVSSTSYSASAYAVLVPVQAYRMEKDSTIIAGDERMLLSALDANGNAVAKPPIDAIVTFPDGSKFTIVSIAQLRPEGTDLFFDCIVRGHA